MADALLARLTYAPKPEQINPIPWPQGLAPTPKIVVTNPNDPLPQCDVLVVTWTAAEAMALADVFTPGFDHYKWSTYARNYQSFASHLTWKSPAREARRLGEYERTMIGNTSVLCYHSQLHLATDDDTAPIIALWQQIIREVRPKLIITTGTAGGIGEATQLGDVFVCGSAKFNCTKTFRNESWAQQRFESTATVRGGSNTALAQLKLIPANAGRLAPVASRMPVITFGGDVETVDYFAFADTDDSYGVIKNDPQAHTEEMDDATLPLALSQMGLSTPFLSIRNASDPEVPSSIGDLDAQKKWAAQIYEKYGHITSIGSAITCWAVIADWQGVANGTDS